MDRLTSKQLRDLLDFLRAGYVCHDQAAFVTHLLHALPTLISSDITSYNEINFESRRLLDGTRVEPPEPPWVRQMFEQYLPEHPFVTYLQQTGDGRAIKISDFLTQRQFHCLGLYNEFFRHVGTEDQMTVSLVAAPPVHIGVALNRSRRDFSERDRLLLNLLRPHLVQAYQNAQAVTGMQREVSFLQQGLEMSGQGVVVLSREGRVQSLSPRAHRWLGAYFGQTRTECLPEAIERWRTHQEAVLSCADDAPPPREPLRVQRDGTCLLVRHLCEADRCLLLLEEQRTAPAPATVERDGLTRREAEVLQWVAQGKTNADIGCILGLSPRTVQKHLERIFDKLGVETRMAAATVALGWRLEGA